MSTLSFIFVLLAALLVGADSLGDEKLQKFEQRLRELARSLSDIPNQHISVMLETTERLSSSNWDSVLIKFLFWISAVVGFIFTGSFILWSLVPSFSILITSNLSNIALLLASIFLGVILANMLTVIMEIVAKLITGFGIGIMLFFLVAGDLLLWGVIAIFTVIDNFVKQKKLKSTLLFISFILGLINVFLGPYTK